MSLEFIEGFDHDAGQIGRKWDPTSSTGSAVAGRFGGNASNTQNNPLVLTGAQLASVTTRILGAAFKFGSLGSGTTLVQFADAGTIQIDFRSATGTGQLYTVTRNGTLLATSTINMLTGQWYYIEFKVTIGSGTAGSVVTRINGVTDINLTGVNTQFTANPTTNGLVFPNPSFQVVIDDLYVLNTSGSVNNTFLGECRIVTTLPSADSATNLQWGATPGPTHYSAVNDNPPNDDTNYVSSATAGQLDTYKYSVSTTGPIVALQNVLCARKDDVGTRTIAAEYRSSGGSNYTGGNSFSPASSYLMYRQIYETDPATGSAWALAAVTGGEFGINCVA